MTTNEVRQRASARLVRVIEALEVRAREAQTAEGREDVERHLAEARRLRWRLDGGPATSSLDDVLRFLGDDQDHEPQT